MYPQTKPRILIIGAGPVGALAAIYAAKRNYLVEVYELRDDLRLFNAVPLNITKSINLTLSERGIQALKKTGNPDLLRNVLAETIPIYGRTIHGVDRAGRPTEISMGYDVHGRYFRVAERERFNRQLLAALEVEPNVTLFFNHKFISADLDQKRAKFEKKCLVQNGKNIDDAKAAQWENVEVDFDLLIGADGAHSVTRQQLSRYAKINLQQTWVDTLWCEFLIPSFKGGGFPLLSDHLHLWPQKRSMFIASPNKNGTFTSQLFADHSIFAELKANPAGIVEFFQHKFPGVTPNLIKPEALQEQFLHNQHSSLIDIKCSPYHYRGSCVIVGDAAHAMVPFYGQGMNTGFEDVRILFEDFLDRSESIPTNAGLQAYSAFRQPDAHAMNELALQHYETLRVGVVSCSTRVRSWIEEWLSLQAPWLGWATLYSRVAFENGRYSDVTRQARRQGYVLQACAASLVLILFSTSLLLMLKVLA
ncbi:hypothetical protein MMC07_002152 [Pseudocyphellaria aurata]|nr:hypothetical protein [Pseudocyphellaria aurata]